MIRMRLLSGPLSMFGAKAQIAALEKGLDVDLVMAPFTSDDRYHPTHPDVLRINPKKQVPILIHGDVEIFDSTQIFEYFEDIKPSPRLWPSEPGKRAHARNLELRSDEVYFPHVVRLMGLEDRPDDPAAVAARAAVAAFYSKMETELAGRDFLAGDFSYADIAFFMAQLFGDRKGAPITEATPQLVRWRERMTQRPSVRQVAVAMANYLAMNGRSVPAWLAKMLG